MKCYIILATYRDEEENRVEVSPHYYVIEDNPEDLESFMKDHGFVVQSVYEHMDKTLDGKDLDVIGFEVPSSVFKSFSEPGLYDHEGNRVSYIDSSLFN